MVVEYVVKMADERIQADPTQCLLFATVDIHGVTVATLAAAAAEDDAVVEAIEASEDTDDEAAKDMVSEVEVAMWLRDEVMGSDGNKANAIIYLSRNTYDDDDDGAWETSESFESQKKKMERDALLLWIVA